MDESRNAPGLALASAVLFGLSTPAAKALAGALHPWMLAGLLYLGSGIGLGLYWLARRLPRRESREAPLARRDAGWLGGAIVAGGIVAPVLLVYGLAAGNAVQASLLLNLETVFTAVLAWSVFREGFDRRIVAGLIAIIVGAAVVSWRPGEPFAFGASSLLVMGACAAWALDNNLTRMVSGGDPVQIAALKGIVAGTINVLLAAAQRAPWPSPVALAGAALVGLVGYGTSLVLFTLALRYLGAARTSAYFSTAPFVGALAAVVALREPVTWPVALAAILMAAGVGLHLAERHAHDHEHRALAHAHAHVADEHHEHAHAPDTTPTEPHGHAHTHAPQRHRHRHYPDLHHRHPH